MSGAVFLTAIAAAAVSLLARRVLTRGLDRAASHPMGCLIAMGLFPFLCVVLFPVVDWLGRQEGRDLGPEEVHEIWSVRLPPGASHVDFKTSQFSERQDVDFSIDEQGFLDWAKENDWRCEPLSGYGESVEPLFRSGDAGAEDAPVQDGYLVLAYRTDNPDYGARVVYDRQRQRVYYRFSTH